MMFPDNEVTRNLKEVAQTLTAVKNTQGEIDKTVTKMKQLLKYVWLLRKKALILRHQGFFVIYLQRITVNFVVIFAV